MQSGLVATVIHGTEEQVAALDFSKATDAQIQEMFPPFVSEGLDPDLPHKTTKVDGVATHHFSFDSMTVRCPATTKEDCLLRVKKLTEDQKAALKNRVPEEVKALFHVSS
jgi:hypothetical protein